MDFDHALLIDDYIPMKVLTARLLPRFNFAEKLTYFDDSVQALDFIRDIDPEKVPYPDLILLDLNMPKLNGWDFLDEFVKIPAPELEKTIVFILSSSPNPKDQELSEQHPRVAGFFEKPLLGEKIKKMREIIDALPGRD